jgi:hypothetical protein
MADDIVVTIELEGADTVASQIAALGDKAKTALDPLNKATGEGGEGTGGSLVSRLLGTGTAASTATPIAGAALASAEEERVAASRARAAAAEVAAVSVDAPAVAGERAGALLATEERPIPVSSVVAQTLKALGVGGAAATVGGAALTSAEPAAAGLLTKIAGLGTSVAGGITTAAPSLTAAVAAAGPALTAAVAAGGPAGVPRAPRPSAEPAEPEPTEPAEPPEPGEGRSIFGGSRRIPISIVVREALSALGVRFPGAGLAAHVGVEAAEQGGAVGAFAAGGVGVLAVGGILAGLASVEDRAKKTRQTLDQIFAPQSGGGIGGQGANERVRGLAERFGTEPETFAAPLANLVRGQRQAGAQVPEAINEKAITSLYEAIRSGGASTSDAAKALADFTADVEKTGHVSADAVKGLEEFSQKGADAVASSFGRINADRLIQDINKGLNIPIGDVAPRLAAFESQNRKAFDSASKDVDTYHTTFSKFTSDLNRDVEKIAGEGADSLLQRIIGGVDKYAQEATQTIVSFKTLITDPSLKTAGDFFNKFFLKRYDAEPGVPKPQEPGGPGQRNVPTTEEERAKLEKTEGIRVTHPTRHLAIQEEEPGTALPEKGYSYTGEGGLRPVPTAETTPFPEKGYYYRGAENAGGGGLYPVPPPETTPFPEGGYYYRGAENAGGQGLFPVPIPPVGPPVTTTVTPHQPPPPSNLPGLTTGAPLGGVTQPVESTAIPAAALPPTPPPSEAINAALNSIAGNAQGAGSGLQSVAESAPGAGSGLAQVASSAPAAGTALGGLGGLSGLFGVLAAAINNLVTTLAAVTVPAATPGGSSAPANPGGATGGLFTGLNFARYAFGGHVVGVGSGKSDSNLALLSRGEYVHQQPAVAHYGLGFMHAINNMTFPKFSLGGLVDHISSAMTIDVPRFASGGLAAASSASSAAAGSEVHLHFPDRTFTGLRAPSQTAAEMRDYARGRQLATTGPRPSWDGG